MFYFLPRKGKRARLGRDFFEKILDMNYDECILTIQSSLYDFPFEGSIEEIHQKVNEVYGVDISNIKNGNLEAIFRRIENESGFS